MNPRALNLLIAGEYICPFRYRAEYDMLSVTSEREDVDTWMRALNMRLCRLGEEGAFFLAPDHIGQKETTQVKNELLKFRDVYGPGVLLLDFIRQADVGHVQLTPGESITLYQLERAVSLSSMLEAHLKALVNVISSAALRNTNHENLRRLLEHLARDGYVVLTNKDAGTYRVAGKMDQLYAVLQFLDENKVLPDTEIEDRQEQQDDFVNEGDFCDGVLL